MTSLNFILFNLIYIIDKNMNMLKAMNNIIMSEIRSMKEVAHNPFKQDLNML